MDNTVIISISTTIATTLATIGLLIVTIFYAVETRKIAKRMGEANKLAEENMILTKELESQRMRPIVYFDIQVDKYFVHLVIKNIGESTAYNVKVNLKNDFIVEIGDSKWVSPLTSETITQIVPKREIRHTATSTSFTDNVDLKYSGQIEYDDKIGTKYIEEFIIDNNWTKKLIHCETNGKTSFEQLQEMNKIMKKLAQLIEIHFSKSKQEKM